MSSDLAAGHGCWMVVTEDVAGRQYWVVVTSREVEA